VTEKRRWVNREGKLVYCIIMRLTFYGGALSVTGANYLLEHEGTKILIDCGLQQGAGFCESENWNPFVYDPSEVKAVFITHAHIDHIGRLPKLVNAGFVGDIYATPPTKAAGEFLLKDSDHILEQEAHRCKKDLLFETHDIDTVLRLWKTVDYQKAITIGPFTITFYNAGHILGSSFILVEAGGRRIVFSGDLGNSPAPLIGARESLIEIDYLVIESTYGDRIHEDRPKRKELLEDVIEETIKKGGVLIIPSFAMERTQELLYEIHDLIRHGRIPDVPVYLDSPLAIKLTEVYRAYDKYLRHDPGVALGTDPGHLFSFPNLRETIRTEESKRILKAPAPKIIIAGSGMSHGGRIIHHEKNYLPDPNNTLLIIGYQAIGSLGRRILDGAETVKILGEDVPVRARIKAIGGYSAHADQPQLMEWVYPMRKTIKKIFVTQGEEEASNALARKFIDEYAVNAEVPKPRLSVKL
jgi:metallo-beta-lactamase family protein